MEGVAARVLTCLLLTVALSGCGWWGDSEEEVFEDDLPTLGAAITSAPAAEAKNADQADNLPQTALAPGTRFALRRHVVQTITQDEVVSRTTLELDLTISIDEIVADGARRFGVHYDRVRYSGKLAGETFDYDSKNAGTAAPIQAWAYRGLVNNSFYFWIDQSGKTKLVGFDRFLRRCVEALPHADREAVLSRLSVISDAEGVARFVDETIGLLADSPLQPQKSDGLKMGDRWTNQRKIGGDVPTRVFTEYIVTSLTADSVEIQIRGIVSPSNQPIVPVSHRGDPLVRVVGGKTIGSCILDRRTGLPKSSRIEQFVDMSVHLADGTTFEQHKHVISTTTRPIAD
jgi:hypothetical protein